MEVLALVAGLGGLAGIAAVVAVATARGRRRLGSAGPGRIDPFTVGEPWRQLVAGAQRARRRSAEAVAGAARGPLRDRLADVDRRLDAAVAECWAIARRGHELGRARAALDLAGTRARLRALDGRPGAPPDPLAGPGAGGHVVGAGGAQATADALRATLASGERIDAAVGRAEDQVRMLAARLEEAAARVIELAAGAGPGAVGELGPGSVGALGGEVDALVEELEAVRQGLEAVGR